MVTLKENYRDLLVKFFSLQCISVKNQRYLAVNNNGESFQPLLPLNRTKKELEAISNNILYEKNLLYISTDMYKQENNEVFSESVHIQINKSVKLNFRTKVIKIFQLPCSEK